MWHRTWNRHSMAPATVATVSVSGNSEYSRRTNMFRSCSVTNYSFLDASCMPLDSEWDKFEKRTYADGLIARNGFGIERFDHFGDGFVVSHITEENIKRRKSLIGTSETHEIQQSTKANHSIFKCLLFNQNLNKPSYLWGVHSSPHGPHKVFMARLLDDGLDTSLHE